jgi:hypothetical protein
MQSLTNIPIGPLNGGRHRRIATAYVEDDILTFNALNLIKGHHSLIINNRI